MYDSVLKIDKELPILKVLLFTGTIYMYSTGQ